MHIAPSAVRWYDDHGLLPSERTAGNQRRFFADVLCRVAMIRAAQRVGLSIDEIRQALCPRCRRGRYRPLRTGNDSLSTCERRSARESMNSSPCFTNSVRVPQ